MIAKCLDQFIYLHLSNSFVSVKYSKSIETEKNWGDALNPYLLNKIINKKILHFSKFYNTGFHKTISFIGSILDDSAIKNLYVIGSGFKSQNSLIKKFPKHIFMVRGPKSSKRLKELGYNKLIPDIYGDPALLISSFYKPSIVKKFKLGIIPHYTDIQSSLLDKFRNLADINIIDIKLPTEKFIDSVLECESIASSSLHGLIVADAYEVPSAWIKIGDRIVGGDFKFYDYFEGVKINKKKILLSTETSLNTIINTVYFESPKFDGNYIISALKSI